LRRQKPGSISFAGNADNAAAVRHVDLARVVWPTPPSASKDRKEQTQNDADDNAGDDREIKRAVFTFDANIAGQTAQPLWREATPQNESKQEHERADDH
jgi:hypothetical protein